MTVVFQDLFRGAFFSGIFVTSTMRPSFRGTNWSTQDESCRPVPFTSGGNWLHGRGFEKRFLDIAVHRLAEL